VGGIADSCPPDYFSEPLDSANDEPLLMRLRRSMCKAN
jgi:hypothetical protein